ncbi:MAG TPA: DedA family protein/thiosulfate sulfurtransferase GlpE [Verrucomicrobiae bacterium]|jgi:membrane protein DedA with SNARE-associated domain/rhodanese-related sulfurtransferase
MSETSQFLIAHGLPIIFAVIFLEQLGLPIPGVPWLLAAGALAAKGKFHWFMGLDATVLACIFADFLWFYLGRFRGAQVLGLLCRISLEPDSCVRRTVNVFTRYGTRGIVVAKFVPGMSTIIPPLAGMSRLGPGEFLLFDGLASLLYCGVFMLLGAVFSNQITQIGAGLAHIGGSAVAAALLFLVLYIAYKYWQRQRLLHELRMAKITVDELGQMLDAGESPLILDLRPSADLSSDPSIIRGAIHVGVDDLDKRYKEFPLDQEIIVYCDCPNEVTSAKVALRLRKKGFKRVRPLLGGIDAWRKGKYPMSVWTKTTTTTTTTVVLSQEPAKATGKEKK